MAKKAKVISTAETLGGVHEGVCEDVLEINRRVNFTGISDDEAIEGQESEASMLKWIFSRLSLLVMLVVLVMLSGCGTTSQELPMLPNTRELFTLEHTYNMTVLVVFDEEMPDVEFVMPDGTALDTSTIRYRPGSNFTQFFFPNAEVGTWTMNYDPLSNTEITTPYSVYMEQIFVRDFAAEEIGSDLLVFFMVSADEIGGFDYNLYAVFTAADNSTAKEVVLLNGNGVLNEMLYTTVDLSTLNDRRSFLLRLEVATQHGQAAIHDSAWLDLRLAQWTQP